MEKRVMSIKTKKALLNELIENDSNSSALSAELSRIHVLQGVVNQQRVELCRRIGMGIESRGEPINDPIIFKSVLFTFSKDFYGVYDGIIMKGKKICE